MISNPAAPAGYRRLFAVPGVSRLAWTMLSARLGGSIWQLGLVLFVLQLYHSPVLAGLAVFVGWMPGLLVSPLAGALLDRLGRVKLVVLDYVVAAASTLALGGLAIAGHLPPWLLLLIAGVSALTVPLGMTGPRTLMPLIVPRELWDTANAVDSATYNLAAVAGPALAGILVATLGGPLMLIVLSAFFAVAALLALGLKEPPSGREAPGRLLRESWAGLRYLFSNPVLRGLSLSIPLLNLADGMVYVALPVLVLSTRGGSDLQVGAMYTAYGVAGLVTGLVTGRLRTEGRERRIMIAALVGTTAGLASMAVFHSIWAGFLGMTLAGLAVGPFDVAMFSLRQRSTRASILGRALAMSMSFNTIGVPIGSALAGPLTKASPVLGLAVAAAFSVVAIAVMLVLLPRRVPDGHA